MPPRQWSFANIEDNAQSLIDSHHFMTINLEERIELQFTRTDIGHLCTSSVQDVVQSSSQVDKIVFLTN